MQTSPEAWVSVQLIFHPTLSVPLPPPPPPFFFFFFLLNDPFSPLEKPPFFFILP